MADLSVEFCGMELKNPTIMSSCSITADFRKIKRVAEAGVGAITTKLISSAVQPPEHDYPLRTVVADKSWCLMGDKNISLDDGVALVKECKKQLNIPVIANFVGIEADVDKWVENGLALQKAGADALELDLYCPQGGPGTSGEHGDGGFGYTALGDKPLLTGKVVKALKQALRIPLIGKIAPGMPLVELAKACEEGGIDCFHVGNVFLGLPGVDVRNGGKPLYQFANKVITGTLQGEYLHPIQNGRLATLAKMTKKPILSGGGVMTWDQMAERIMLGAQAVPLCSTIYMNGLGVIGNILKKFDAYCNEYGYNKLEDFRGCSLSDIVLRADADLEPCVARIVDEKKCLDCKDVCAHKVNAECLAMSLNERGIPQIDEEACNGCSLCYWACASRDTSAMAVNNISMFGVKEYGSKI